MRFTTREHIHLAGVPSDAALAIKNLDSYAAYGSDGRTLIALCALASRMGFVIAACCRMALKSRWRSAIVLLR